MESQYADLNDRSNQAIRAIHPGGYRRKAYRGTHTLTAKFYDPIESSPHPPARKVMKVKERSSKPGKSVAECPVAECLSCHLLSFALVDARLLFNLYKAI